MAKATPAMFKVTTPLEHVLQADDDEVATSTASILQTPEGQSMHRLELELVQDRNVSTISRWGDDFWALDVNTPGSERTGLNWRMKVVDGRSLTDPGYASMLDWTKRFIWSLLASPGEGMRPLVPGSMASVGVGLKSLVYWMSTVDIQSPDDLTPERVSDYFEDLGEVLTEAGEATVTQAWLRVRVLQLLWRQRKVLAECGIPPMPKSPFGVESSFSVARKIGSIDVGWINPIPDEVAVKVLNGAHQFIDLTFETTVRMVRASYEAYFSEGRGHRNGPGTSKHSRHLRSKAALMALRTRNNLKVPAESVSFGDAADLRDRFTDLVGAALCVIQGGTGMRGSELAAMSGGQASDTGFPRCIRTHVSPSGLFEIFTLASAVSKSESGARTAEWVAGMRLRGENDVPPVVRAVQVVDQLFEPIRKATGITSLFLSLPPGVGLPKTRKGVGKVFTGHLREWQRRFIERHVDLSGLPNQSSKPVRNDDLVEYRESRGRCIKPTQFRKAFAAFAVQVSSDLIPALAMHFKHVSHAMTEGGYIGNNPTLLAERNSLATQKTASMFADLVHGRQKFAGRRGVELTEQLDQLRALVPTDDLARGWTAVNRIVSDIGVVGWFHTDGTCLPLDPSEMRCHINAGTIPRVDRVTPNFEFRRASVCSGCKNYLIAGDNLDFWIKRFRSNRFAEIARRCESENASRAIFAKRAQVAAKWLKLLGVDVERLDREVREEVKQWEEGQR